MDSNQEAFKNFIQRYVDVSAQELLPILREFESREIFRNELLFRAGTICQDFVFVVQGSIRLFCVIGEIETSVWFSFKNSICSDVQSFISGKPGKFNVQALTDGCLLTVNKNVFERLRHESKAWNQFYIKLCEEAVISAIDRLVDFQYKSAEQRYIDLLAIPQYIETIPQKYLASYLGITPTSLSRLRKKISGR